MSDRKKFKRNIIANLIGKIWSMCSIFIFIPLYIKVLGLDAYGLISFFAVLQSMIYLFGGGLSTTLRRYFSISEKNYEDKLRKYKLLRSIEFIYISIGLLVILFHYFGAQFISERWLNIDNIKIETVILTIRLMGFSIAFQMLADLYSGGLLGLEQQVKTNIIQFFWSLIKNGLVVLIIIIKPDIVYFYLWFVICDLIYMLINRFNLVRALSLNKKEWNFKDISNIQTVWKFSLGIFFISLISALNSQLDKVIISKYLDISELGIYNMSFSLAQIPVIITSAIAVTIFARFTMLSTGNKLEELESFFKKSYRLTVILIISLGINISLYSKELLLIWTSNLAISEKGSDIVSVISIGSMFLALQIIPYNLALAHENTKTNILLGIVNIILLIPMIIVMVQKMGLLGAALTWLILMTISTFIYNNLVFNKHVNKHYLMWFFRSTLIPMFTITLISIICYRWMKILGFNLYGSIIFAVVSGIFILFISLRMFSKEEFIFLKQIIKKSFK